jgi:geranylgeranyl diphosphate synthase type II
MWRKYLKEHQTQVESCLQTLVPAREGSLSRIMESMRYSLFAGGKRLRPILLLAAADAVGAEGGRFLQSACALEMIHTYSLIHDDLPAMDDDDYRRGRLTNHKVFGDGMAILAGDGLLTLAFETLLSQPGVAPEILAQVAREVAQARSVRHGRRAGHRFGS